MGVVLAGVDGTASGRDAIALGVALAAMRDDALRLVYAHPYGELESLLGEGEMQGLVREVVEDALVAVRGPQGTEDARATMQLVADRSPARALQRLAEQDDVRAIAVGSSHRGALGRVVPGGVAQRLLSGAPCPVVVAPVGWADRERRALGLIGLGFDGSAQARAAWSVACELASASDARLRVVAVHQPLAFGHVPAAATATWVSVNDEVRDALRRSLDELVDAAPDGVDVEPVFVDRGDPARALAEQSRELDLLIVGSRGYGPVLSVLLGSVAGRLIGDASCPVMVVPRPD